MLLTIWKHCREIRVQIVVLVGIMVLEAILSAFSISLVLPITSSAIGDNAAGAGETGWITDIVPDAYRGNVKLLLLFLAFVLFLKFLVSCASTLLSVRYTEKLRLRWQTTLSRKYILQPFKYMAGERQGAIMNDLITETDVASVFTFSYLNYLSQIIIMCSVLGLLLSVNWMWLMMGGVIAVLGFIFVGIPYFRFARALGKRGVTLGQDLNSMMYESFSGIKDIKISTSENFQLGKIYQLARDNTRNRRQKRVAQMVPTLSKDIVLAVVVVLVAVYIPSDLSELKPVLPQIALFIVAVSQLVAIASNLISLRFKVMSKYQSFLQVAQRMAESDMIVEDLEKGDHVSDLGAMIAFEEAGFAYDGDKTVFERLNITLPRGQTICIFGPSGAGKTTLVDLLVRLYDVDSGRLSIDGRDVREVSLKSWRGLIGYVPQEPILYYGSVRENLTLGRSGISDADIRRACEIATAWEFIEQLPQGLDTLLVERGGNLSGGQRKRLALARAIVQGSQLIILDETTGAIQEAAERALVKNIKKLDHVTLVIISHRESTARLADISYLIENGGARAL